MRLFRLVAFHFHDSSQPLPGQRTNPLQHEKFQLPSQGKKLWGGSTGARRESDLGLFFQGRAAAPLKSLLLCSLLLTWIAGLAFAADTKTETTPLQAVLVKTPEEKAKAEAQIPSYPLKTCLVSGDELGGMGDTVNALYGGRLIRFCCKGCIKSFNKNPDQYLPKLESTKKTSP